MSKSSRNKNYSVAANKRTVDTVFNGNESGYTFAKVLAHLGDRKVSVYYENERKQGNEGIATICGVLKKNKTPIRSNDVVVILPLQMTRDGKKMRFELRGVLSSKEASDAKKKNLIPDYFLNNADTASFAKKDTSDMVEFEYDGDLDDNDINAI